MYPILFEENSTAFNTNGIGRLSDALSCKVTEQRNGIYELEMSYQMHGQHYSDIGLRKIIVAKPSANGSLQPFRIYKVTRPINGKVTIYAQHISYDLSKNTTMPFTVAASGTACNTTLQGLKINAVETCPFTFQTDVTTIAGYTQKTPASIKQRMGGIEGSVLDQFGGEYEYDKFTVKLWRNRGTVRNITLRYGKNITDLNQEENINNTVTGIVPFWIDAEGNNLVTLSERAVYNSNYTRYSSRMVIPVDLSGEWDDRPTEAQLRAAATVYVNQQGFGVPKVSTKVSFVDLADTEEYKDILPLQNVNLCDTITVQFEKLGISTTAKIVETVYDVLKEKYESVQVGEPKSTLSSTISGIESDMAQSIDTAKKRVLADIDTDTQDIVNQATAWLTSADGYVVAIKDSNGKWTELLFMDTDDADTARNVLRINMNGIGFSHNGVGGPYVSAWTIDGSFNADNIVTGILRGAAGDNYWNMQTGEFCLSSTAKLKIKNTTYTGVVQPTNSNYPASSWSSDSDKASHVGETYYDSAHDKTYKYTGLGSGVVLTFGSRCKTEPGYDYVKLYYQKNGTWYESGKFDGGESGSTNNIAGKRVYIPTTEFYLYFYSDTSVTAWGYDIASIEYVNSNPTGTNYFTAAGSDPRPSASWTTVTIGSSSLPESQHEYPNNSRDAYKLASASSERYFWQEYNPTVGSYVADSISGVEMELDQESVFNALTNNGQAQGIYLQNGNLYINGQYIGTGQISIGGSSYGSNPTLQIKDTGNNVIGSWTRDGIAANKGNFGILNIDGNTNSIYVNGTKYITKDEFIEIWSTGKSVYYTFKPYIMGIKTSFDLKVHLKLDDTTERGGVEPAIDDNADYSNAGIVRLRYWDDDNDTMRTISAFTITNRESTYVFNNLDYEVGNGNNYYSVSITIRKQALISNEVVSAYIENVKMPSFSREAITGSFYGDLVGSAYLDNLKFGMFSYDRDNKSFHGEHIRTGAEFNIRHVTSGSTTGLFRVERTYEGSWQSVEWASSDERVKEDIKPLSMELSRKFIEGTEPKEFKYKNTTPLHYGMIAQEARRLLDYLGQEDAELEHSMDIDEEVNGIDDQRTIDYHEYIPHLINYVKYLKAQIEELRGEKDDNTNI